MAVDRSRAARVDLRVGTGRARNELKNFARDAKRHLGDIGKGSYHGKGIFQSRGALWRDRAGRAGRAVGRGAMAAGGLLAGGVAGVAAIGGLGVLSVADDVYELEKALTRFEITTEKTPEQMAAFRAELRGLSRASGIAGKDLLAGAAAYVTLTGDSAGAAKGMATFARVASATGASMEDIAGTAAAMKDNLGIDPKDFEAAFSALHVQGKAGAVEIRELATELAGIAPSFADFKGGGGVEGLKEMGAAVQVIRKGFGSTSQAATAMQALMVSMKKNAGKFQKAGVRIFDKDPKTGKKRLRDFSDIIDAIAQSKLAKDPTLLQKAFGRDEAVRAYDQLVRNRALMDDLIRAGANANAIAEDAAKYAASPAGRIETAWNAVKLALADAFTPERIEVVVGLIEDLVSGLEHVSRLVRGFLISEQQHQENKDYLAKRERGIDRVQAVHYGKTGKFISREQAEQQFRTEEAQFSNLRQGVYDDRSVADLLENLQRVRSGVFARGEDFERVLETKIQQRMLGLMTGGWAGIAPTPPVVVKIDGTPVAKAAANAPGQRTRPGGI